MARWLLKAGLQRILGMLPQPHAWNEFFQVYLTRSVRLSGLMFTAKLRHCRQFLEQFRRHRADQLGSLTAFDLGTGWFPVVPVGLFLCGADKVHTCDLVPLLRPSRVRAVLEKVVSLADQAALATLLPELVPDRVGAVRRVLASSARRTAAEMLAELNIEVIVGDARRTRVLPGSVDLFVSVDVLGHIPSETLAEILEAFRGLAKPDALMCHRIDLADLYWYFDRSLTPFHFLRFTSKAWSWIDNPIIPMNRLRICDYRRLVAEAGFKVIEEQNLSGRKEDLDRFPPAAEFSRYQVEDLLVHNSWLVARAAPHERRT